MPTYHLMAARPTADGQALTLAYDICVEASGPEAAITTVLNHPSTLVRDRRLAVWIIDDQNEVIWALRGGVEAAARVHAPTARRLRQP